MNDHEKIARIHAGIADGKVVRFSYRSPTAGLRFRVVSPYETYTAGKDRDFYILGWDHDRQGMRQFRIPAIDGIVLDSTVEYVKAAQEAVPEPTVQPRARPRRAAAA